jgi:RNA polymerase sigma-70 factor (ECF subfamily)
VDDPSIDLLARWQAGDQEAAAQMFRRYAQRLIALARSRLSSKLAQRLDPEDVVQSAYRSFFAGARMGQYDLQRGGDLWRLLVGITLHKLHDQVKRHSADKRDVGAENSFGSEDSLWDIDSAIFARGPSPAEAVALVDELEQVMRRLEPLQRRILEMRLQGFSLEEIATDTQRCPRTVRRTLARIRRDLQQNHGADPEP